MRDRDSEEKTVKASKKKPTKAKGPLRTGALIPLVLFFLIVVVYMSLFFDNHLRWGLQYGATYANGAEVNIGALNINWGEPSLTISKIQVTNKEKPTHNLVSVGKFKLQLLWDGLLRGKVVVPDSGIENIAANSERKRIGRVLPPKQSGGSGKGAVDEAAQKTIQQIAQKNETNLLSDIMAVAGGTNYKDQLKKLEGQIAAKGKIKDLEKALKVKEAEWKKRIDALPKESELKKIEQQVKSFKFDSSNPAAIKASLKELDRIYKDAQTKYKSIETAKNVFDKDLKAYKGTYKNLEATIKKDIQDIAGKLNLPSLDPQEITQMLLGNLVAKHLAKIEKYKNLAREYMPPKKKETDDVQVLTPREREVGRDFSFPKKKSYPLLWIKNINLSSSSDQGELAGDVSGTIKNITDAPGHLGIPATAHIEGNFPKEKIMNIIADITVDHTKEIARESAKISVGSFPVQKNYLSQSSDVEFGYNKAVGNSGLDVSFEAGTMTLNSKSVFQQLDYFITAKSKQLEGILKNVAKGLKEIDLNVRAQGSWKDLSLNINSNLGRKISDAIKRVINAEIAKARKDVEAHVRGLVDKEKKKLQGEVAKIEQKFGVDLKNKDAAVKSVKQKIENAKKEAKEKEKKKLEAKGKKELEKIKKKFKLPF